MVEEGLTTPSGGRLVRILTLMAALTAAGGVAGCVAPGSAPTGVQTVSATRTAGVQAPLASGETQIIVRAVAFGGSRPGAFRRALRGGGALVSGGIHQPGPGAGTGFRCSGAGGDGHLPVRHGLGQRRGATAGGVVGGPRRMACGRDLGRHRHELRGRCRAWLVWRQRGRVPRRAGCDLPRTQGRGRLIDRTGVSSRRRSCKSG